MFKNFINRLKESEDKLKNRADILFDKTKDKKENEKISKKYSAKKLGIDEENELSILNDKKFWNEKDKKVSKQEQNIKNKENKEVKHSKKGEKDYNEVADLMYPTMKKKENTKKPEKLNYNEVKNSSQTKNDKNFFSALDVVFSSEGGYSNNKNDKGGPTNMGITQKTYDNYCKKHNLKTKDVKELSKGDIIQVYYNDYWVKSGLDKENDPIKSLILFDTAVLHGVGKTKEFYKKSDGNIQKILDLRREHYKKRGENDPTQKQFEKGWNKRVDKLQQILNRYEKDK